MVHIIWFSTLDYTIDNSEHFVGYIVHNQEIGINLWTTLLKPLYKLYQLITRGCKNNELRNSDKFRENHIEPTADICTDLQTKAAGRMNE